jgi:hypothetical protein
MPLADFSSWLAEQQNFADKLMDEYNKRHEPYRTYSVGI